MNFLRSIVKRFSKKPKMETPPDHNFGEPWEGADVQIHTPDGQKLYSYKELLDSHTDYFKDAGDSENETGEKERFDAFNVPCDHASMLRILQFIHTSDPEFDMLASVEGSRMEHCKALIRLLAACEKLRFEKVEKVIYDALDEFVVELAVISLRNGDREDVLHRVTEFHPSELTLFLGYDDQQQLFTKCDLVLFYLVLKDSRLLNPKLTLQQSLNFIEILYGFPEFGVEPTEPVELEDVANLRAIEEMSQQEDSEVALLANGSNGRKFYGSKLSFSAICRVLKERIDSVDRQMAASERLAEPVAKKCTARPVKHQKKKKRETQRKCTCTEVEKKLFEEPKEVPVISLDVEFATLDLILTLAYLSDNHQGLNLLERTHPALIYDLYVTADVGCLDVPFIRKLVSYFIGTHMTLDTLDLAVRLNMHDARTRILRALPLSSVSMWLQRGITGVSYVKGDYEIRLGVPRDEQFLTLRDLSAIVTRLGEAKPVVL